MKKKTVLLCVLTLCLLLCSCSAKKEEPAAETLTIKLSNLTEGRLCVLNAGWYHGTEPVGAAQVEIANGDKGIGEGPFTVSLSPEELPENTPLEELTFRVSVIEYGGEMMDVAAQQFSASFGDSYMLELRYEDGCYSVWQNFGNGVYARLTEAGAGTDGEPETLSAEYEAILDKYTTAITEGWDPETCMAEGVNYLIGMYQKDTASEDIGYAVKDLDGDGTQELVIASMPSVKDPYLEKLIYDLYTVKDSNCILVFASIERNRLFYLGDDHFANIGSNGWNDSVDVTLALQEYALTEVAGAADPADYVQLELTPFSARS